RAPRAAGGRPLPHGALGLPRRPSGRSPARAEEPQPAGARLGAGAHARDVGSVGVEDQRRGRNCEREQRQPRGEIPDRDLDRRRDQARRDEPLGEIDHQHPEGDCPAERAERIRGARIAAAERADVDPALEAPDEEAPDDRAEKIGEARLDDELGHAGRNTSAIMQRTLPPPSLSMVGTGIESTLSVQPESCAKASWLRLRRAVSDITTTRESPSASSQVPSSSRLPAKRSISSRPISRISRSLARSRASTRSRSPGAIAEVATTPSRSPIDMSTFV